VGLRCHTLSLVRLRPSSDLRNISPRPHGRLESNIANRRHARALPWCCFPVVCLWLQRPPLAHIRPYPPRRLKTPQIQVPPAIMRVFKEHLSLKNSIRLAERGKSKDISVDLQIICSKALWYFEGFVRVGDRADLSCRNHSAQPSTVPSMARL
jgi:hypothetical protein